MAIKIVLRRTNLRKFLLESKVTSCSQLAQGCTTATLKMQNILRRNFLRKLMKSKRRRERLENWVVWEKKSLSKKTYIQTNKRIDFGKNSNSAFSTKYLIDRLTIVLSIFCLVSNTSDHPTQLHLKVSNWPSEHHFYKS